MEQQEENAPRSGNVQDVSVGTVLGGKYKLLSLLGQGGMGAVWRAEHLELSAPVAIKLISLELVNNPDLLARFQREAKAAASLRSPHVVQILDYGVDSTSRIPFIAMELLEGESLADRLEREGRMAPDELCRVFGHVARALSRAHDAGIVHRDLKPDNIFLVHNDEEEIAKVLDFGIAKVDSLTVGGSSTATGMVFGTAFYMSPEQISGARNVDLRTDLWALGVIAYECLTGYKPFDSNSLGGLVLQICTHELPIPSNLHAVPPGFDDWFARALARDQQARFQTARELVNELRKVCLGVDAPALRGRTDNPRLSATSGVISGVAPTLRGDSGEQFAAQALLSTGTGGPLSNTVGKGIPTLHKPRSNAVVWVAALGSLAMLGAAGSGVWWWLNSSSATAISDPVAATTENALAAAPVLPANSISAPKVATAASEPAPPANEVSIVPAASSAAIQEEQAPTAANATPSQSAPPPPPRAQQGSSKAKPPAPKRPPAKPAPPKSNPLDDIINRRK